MIFEKYSIHKSIALSLVLMFCYGSLLSQGSFMPKIGINMPQTAPAINNIVFDMNTGFSLGLDYRSEGDRIYFNPGLHIVNNRTSFLQQDTLNPAMEPEIFAKNSHNFLKLILGGGISMAKFGRASDFHARLAFVPVFKTANADYSEVPVNGDVQKWISLEMLFGLGLDLSNFTFDFDYNLALLKGFKDADIVQNAFTISMGFRI